MKLLWERTADGGYNLELPFLQLLIYQDLKERKGWFYVISNSNSDVLFTSEALSRMPTKEDAEVACITEVFYLCQQQIQTLQQRIGGS